MSRTTGGYFNLKRRRSSRIIMDKTMKSDRPNAAMLNRSERGFHPSLPPFPEPFFMHVGDG
ncbi:MAG TPA: hypothetical protein VGC89_14735 [Pyrinomonadaceae bacterium]